MIRILFIVLFISVNVFGQVLHFDGVLHKDVLYFQNPEIENHQFCVDSIHVNGKTIPFENASAFEVDFKKAGFHVGDSIHFTLFHQLECRPTLLLNTCFFSSDTLKIRTVAIQTVSDNVEFTITTNLIQSRLAYFDIYTCNKWLTIDSFALTDTTIFTANFEQLYSGRLQFRIRSGHLTSKTFGLITGTPELHISIEHQRQSLHFSRPNFIELYNSVGRKLYSGIFQDIPTFQEDGVYYLNADNKSHKLVVKNGKIKLF